MMNLRSHKHINIKTFLRYSIVGLSGTAVDFGGLLLLVEVGGMQPVVANVISVSLAIINNYLLNKFWTFSIEKKKKLKKEFAQFVVVSLVGLLINLLLLPLLIQLGIWYVAAKVLIIGIVVLWNFFGNALWTFNH